MNSIQDCYTLNNGMKLPCVGFGTYQTINGAGKAVILDAIRAGSRFFDAASLYETERALGAAIKESGLPREDFIIETKLWIDEMGYENAKKALAASLERLQMDYVDLYMIHWPRQTGADDENWKALDLETEPGEYSYPAIVCQGGTLYAAYTWQRRRIVFVQLKI